ncbi:major capsid protein [Flyfo microvirus Tbat2_158]|nr:major capsid protein [Flyfo microvirus Tbat2_158]
MNNQHSTGPVFDGNRFSVSPNTEVQHSTFQRDQVIKTTFNAGDIVPFYVDEVLPGDTHNIDLAFITRTSPMLTPTMDNIELDFYFFFVPNRLTFDGWEELNAQSKEGWSPDEPPALVPVCTATTETATQLSRRVGDYYGIPPGAKFYYNNVSLLPFRGYGLIYNRWFRDQNVQAPLVVQTGSNNYNVPASAPTVSGYHPNSLLLQANKKHDYFTSCLIGTNRPASKLDFRIPSFLNQQSWSNGAAVLPYESPASMAGDVMTTTGSVSSQSVNINFIQAIRNAAQLNKLLERDARGGVRYVEMLKAHFNVQPEDYRLQEPEFLGHYNSSVGVSQVPQTSSTDSTSPQANLAAFSLTAGNSSVFTKTFVEHGYIHGFVIARQRKTYQQGIEKFWFRRDRFDFYYPEFANITEQPVYMKEIFHAGTLTDSTATFGVQEAWADYRYKPSRVSGQMRSNVTNSLDIWHYADNYATRPVYSDAWIKDNSKVNIDRTLAISSSEQDQIIADIKVINNTTRKMPLYSIPGNLDHF